ncbi:hypothetical protein PGT21_016438 [Puccinia graminis f. sp. tritici]|uniref:Uncharacterized protein n=1 Tax=Puccinia graminis f. sp. tritici TaxID=56615 RepID=A0A5B0MT43_PUCGR|nr:hypothetical protein PGT21_016438 [Puccinia graminis f. sp. tritici]
MKHKDRATPPLCQQLKLMKFLIWSRLNVAKVGQSPAWARILAHSTTFADFSLVGGLGLPKRSSLLPKRAAPWTSAHLGFDGGIPEDRGDVSSVPDLHFLSPIFTKTFLNLRKTHPQ